jgi:hypothetical protein
MRAAIVLGDDLDVLVTLETIHVVLDPEVGKVNRLLEVRQVVLVRPLLDLTRVAIGPPIAVRPAAVSLLEPFLVFALELLLEDDAPDLAAVFTEPFFLPQIGAIELRVVRQLPRAADAGMEGLLAWIVALAAMGFQEVATTFRERHRARSMLERYEPHEPFLAQMAQGGITRTERLLSCIVQIPLGHDPKRADRPHPATLIAIQFVSVVAIEDDLSFRPARQIEAVDERIAWVSISNVGRPLARVVGQVTHVLFRWSPAKRDPMRFNVVARVVVSIARITIKHRCTSR